MPGFFCFAHIVRENGEDVLPFLHNVKVVRNIGANPFEFWPFFWIEREVQSAPIDLIFMLDLLGFLLRVGFSRVEPRKHGLLEAHLVVSPHVDARLAVSNGSWNFDVPASTNWVVFVDMKGEIRDGLQSPSRGLLLEILQVPDKKFLDVFNEPGIQIRSLQDGRILGLEALCIWRVAVKNGEFVDEHGVDFDGLVSLLKALHYLEGNRLRLFQEGIDLLNYLFTIIDYMPLCHLRAHQFCF